MWILLLEFGLTSLTHNVMYVRGQYSAVPDDIALHCNNKEPDPSSVLGALLCQFGGLIKTCFFLFCFVFLSNAESPATFTMAPNCQHYHVIRK